MVFIKLAHLKLLSLALKIRQLEPFAFYLGAGKYKQSLENCPNFNHVKFYAVIYPIN